MSESKAMNALAVFFTAIFAVVFFNSPVSGQTFARSPSPSSSGPQLEQLAKKIDEQNAKIDMLSQQILKLQQELTGGRSGVMIGEGATSPSPSVASAPQHSVTAPASTAAGNSHVVSRGETLTSIAKMYKVTVDELQKFNHIENPLKLQVGQTIMIPGATSPSPAESAGE